MKERKLPNDEEIPFPINWQSFEIEQKLMKTSDEPVMKRENNL